MKSIVGKYRGWFVTFTLGIALSMLVNDHPIRQISNDYLRDLINRRDIAYITIVKSKLAIRERYMAEITLTATALKRYAQTGAKFSSSSMGPHLIVSAGSSASEVDQWEQSLRDKNGNFLSVKKNY